LLLIWTQGFVMYLKKYSVESSFNHIENSVVLGKQLLTLCFGVFDNTVIDVDLRFCSMCG